MFIAYFGEGVNRFLFILSFFCLECGRVDEWQLTNIDTPPRKFLKKRLTAKKTGFMGINRKSSFLFWGVVVVWGQ